MKKYTLSQFTLPDFEAKDDQEALSVAQSIARLLATMKPMELDKASKKIQKMASNPVKKKAMQAWIRS